ncbi:MAG: hydroxymethylglutaryl-CoA lyase [Leptospiraceae bacterium]|nr:hydroxymethylglutaryl-CoA lyase [Leptospiraceae bacterium]MBP9164271.1 hydroxymethylglutaryl-CoA lyase [Leptospiraceae bacterium]
MKEKIKITEVGPRDGLQNETKVISTEDKSHFINLLIDAGLKNIEVTSFVKADKIPQLSDATELSKQINFQNAEIAYSALTPNLKGYEVAIQSGFKEVAIFGAASESFTKKNINRTIEESLSGFKELTDRAQKDGIKVRGYISTVVACPYEGKISPDVVNSVVLRMQDLGVYEISLGETIGVAVPSEVELLLNALLKKNNASFFAGHFHDTYGMAIANVSKSLEMGLRSFDSSAGGLGGCPYAKGASGNLATEDLVYFLECSNFESGANLDILVKASQFMELKLNKPLLSKTYLARKKILEL